MNVTDIFARYCNHWAQVAEKLNQQPGEKYQLKGCIGSLYAFVLGAIFTQSRRNAVFIAQDREEALYVCNDLELLLPQKTVLLFPSSSKGAYQIEKIDNANVLQRAEVLSTLNHSEQGDLFVVTYPEALAEKVVNRKALVVHTLEVKVGSILGLDFVLEVLEEYGYEQTTFVHEPGQFAHRGGIIDVFSYSFEYPYRIEFKDDEIESIRVFQPSSQLSINQVLEFSLIPNFRANLLVEEERVSFLQYSSPLSVVWVRDVAACKEEIQTCYTRAENTFQQLQVENKDTLQSQPSTLYQDGDNFLQELSNFTVFECSNTTTFSPIETFVCEAGHQPAFKKEFNLLTEHLYQNQQKQIQNIIFCENESQIRRLKEIFTQLNPAVEFIGIPQGIYKGYYDKQLQFACYTDHQIFERYHKYKSKVNLDKSHTIKEITQLQPGDYVTHVNYGIGRFAGLEKVKSGNTDQEAIKIIYEGGDTIYVNINALYKIARYSGKDGTAPKLNKLGSAEWAKTKAKVKKRIKELAFDLVMLYAQRKAAKGYAYAPDTYIQHELEASFLYEDTPDQEKATDDVKRDMESVTPMDRLVCGDVGFGKTEIAVRAACKAACDGKQVAVLVPTTILAMQHYHTFSERYTKLPINVDYINRFKSKKEQTDVLKKLADGKIDVIIGTHRLLSKDVTFKNIGLLIIDEEHKFGVGAKEKLRLLRMGIDTLTLTATPIPRTLQFSLLNIRDLSIINTPPPNRQPVDTTVLTFKPEIIRDAISYELKRGGQVFFIHNRVAELNDMAAMIKRLVPDAHIGITHGQQSGEQIEETMLKFIEREYDVLVCTTIIESGLDIPNANTIIINQAHFYGLSDLHQMRGRVGRSNRKAYCYLLAPPLSVLPTDARKRLQAIEEFSDLGSGFQISMRDLDIRGAGDILGKEQSGFITEIGYDMYHKILDEAVQELKEEHILAYGNTDESPIVPKGAYDCQLDTDFEILIPDKYIPNVAERLQYYQRISEIKEDSALIGIAREMRDRFGIIPAPVLDLFDAIRVRELSKKMGFEKVVLKEEMMRAFFIQDSNAAFFKTGMFQNILTYITKHPHHLKLKQVGNNLQLQVRDIQTIKDAYFFLKELQDFVLQTGVIHAPTT